jgi:hypothetical protein
MNIKLLTPINDELRVTITDRELYAYNVTEKGLRIFIIRKIQSAIIESNGMEWRKVLGTDNE